MKTEYKVIVSPSGYRVNGHLEFEKEVNNSLAEGWKCQGGVSISYCQSSLGGFECHYAQAMIRETEE